VPVSKSPAYLDRNAVWGKGRLEDRGEGEESRQQRADSREQSAERREQRREGIVRR
jgi:hypothetical protein